MSLPIQIFLFNLLICDRLQMDYISLGWVTYRSPMDYTWVINTWLTKQLHFRIQLCQLLFQGYPSVIPSKLSHTGDMKNSSNFFQNPMENVANFFQNFSKVTYKLSPQYKWNYFKFHLSNSVLLIFFLNFLNFWVCCECTFIEWKVQYCDVGMSIVMVENFKNSQ